MAILAKAEPPRGYTPYSFDEAPPPMYQEDENTIDVPPAHPYGLQIYTYLHLSVMNATDTQQCN
jgi:hypothetical protein